jgi:polysaccharide export outer membrane protein
MFGEPNTDVIAKKIDSAKKDYIIQPGDELNIKFFTRDGASLIEPIKSEFQKNQDVNSSSSEIVYIVDNFGNVNIPLLGKIKASGMTENNLKRELENQFSEDYNSPYVVLSVTNRRAFIFKGTQAGVVTLNKTPMSIFELIAKSGGLDRHLNSSNILLVRGNPKSPTIYKLDLSTFKGIQNSETIIQPNDIVYITENKRKAYHALQDIAPIVTLPLSIISSILTTVVIIITLRR